MPDQHCALSKKPRPSTREALQKVVEQDVWDAYLLVDYLSGKGEPHVRDLKVLGHVPVIAKICELQRAIVADPHSHCTETELLFAARTELNRLARPATGLTIAYTLLVSAGESGRRELAGRAYPDIADSAI